MTAVLVGLALSGLGKLGLVQALCLGLAIDMTHAAVLVYFENRQRKATEKVLKEYLKKMGSTPSGTEH